MKSKTLMAITGLALFGPAAVIAATPASAPTTMPVVHVRPDSVVVNPRIPSEQDRAINERVVAALAASERLHGQTIEVSTVNGVVRLSGNVDLVPQIYEAVAIARRTEGVRAVNDDALL